MAATKVTVSKTQARKAGRRAAIYARISADDHRENEKAGLGVERQLQDLRRHCKREGWAAFEYVDNDRGASRFSKRHRPEFQRMMTDVADGRLDVIVVAELSRYTREPRMIEDLIDRSEDASVELVSLQGGAYDVVTPEGRMRLRMEATVSAHYSDFVSAKIKRKKEEMRENGRGPGGSRAFGYKGRHPGKQPGMTVQAGTVIDRREAAAYRKAVADVLAGATLTSIAKRWNDAGFRTPKTGSLWAVPSVRVTLLNPRHAGLLARSVQRDGRKVYDVIGDATWPAIISVADHRRITRLLTDPDRRHKNPPRRGLLTGFVRCHCGGKMRRDGRTYRCHPMPESTACGSNSILADRLDEKVTEAVLFRLASPAVTRALTKPPESRRAARKGDDPVKLQHELDELAALAGTGELPMREYLIVRKPLEARLTKAQADAQPASSPSSAAALLEAADLDKAWRATDLDRKRRILAELVETITIGPKTKTARGFDYDRLDIDWKA